MLLFLAIPAQAQTPDYGRYYTARSIRWDATSFQYSGTPAVHADNNDEELYPTRFASFSKGLPHNSFGEPDLTQYSQMLEALLSGDAADFEAIVLGGERKLVNPQAGFSFTLEGADPQAITMRPAPTFASLEAAGEMEELYWMSLVRDVRFDQYASDPTISQAANRLSLLAEYRGARASNGFVTPATLFRADLPAAVQGPFISQLLWKAVPYGGGPLNSITEQNPPAAGVEPTGVQVVEQRNLTRLPGDDRVTAYSEWLSIQNGAQPADPTDTLEDFDPVRRYIRNGRDLAEWVHFDYPLQASLNAALLVARQGDFLPDGRYDPDPKSSPRAEDLNSPYRSYSTQEPFVTFGNSDAQSVTALVTNTSLRAQWFQKWQVHRRLRPEEYGGRVHNTLTGARTYPVPTQLLVSPVLPLILSRTAAVNAARGLGSQGTYLLPQAFPEGSPVHPAYGSGHSTYSGAGVTVLKAFYADFPVINPQVPNADGTALTSYSGTLMYFDELDKLAANIGVARLFAGVHYRSDHDHAVRLGELYALRTLQDWVRLYNERLPNGTAFPGYQVRTFGGSTLTVGASTPVLPNAVSAVNAFALYNTANNTPIAGYNPLANGAVIDLSDLAAQGITRFTLRAISFPSGDIGSVRFTLDGSSTNVNATPYALNGATFPVATVGSHVVSATPFSQDSAAGVGGVPLTVRYTVQQ